MAQMPVSPAAFPQNRPSAHSAAKRGQDYGRNGHFPLPRFRKIGLLCVLPRNAAGTMPKCPFPSPRFRKIGLLCVLPRNVADTMAEIPFPPPRFRKIGLLCVLARNAAGEAGLGVHEGIGGKGDARGPCARSGAALQHDGVRSRTVRHAEGAAKRDALAVKRLGQPPFPPLTEWIPHPAAGRNAQLNRSSVGASRGKNAMIRTWNGALNSLQGQKRRNLHLDRGSERPQGAKTP